MILSSIVIVIRAHTRTLTVAMYACSILLQPQEIVIPFMDGIWLRMWMYSLILCCGNKFIRSNKNREFTDCDAWGEKKEKWNNIGGNSNSNGNGNRIKWLAQPLSHQQNRGCDMVLSFVTLKNVRRTKWMRIETVDEVRMRKNERIWRLFVASSTFPICIFYSVYSIPFPFSIHMNACVCVSVCGCSQYTSFVQMKGRLKGRGEGESKRKTL